MIRPLTAVAFVALLAVSVPAFTEVAVPPLKARVIDLTATLSTQQQSTLEESLRAFEARKGSLIAVLIVPTTQPETVEQFAIRVEDSANPRNPSTTIGFGASFTE
jgi:uncharacterized protein